MKRESSGHTKALRETLRAARKREGLTQDEVAAKIAEIEECEPPSNKTISAWERFDRHPPINMFAAWARAVGMQLVVNIDEGSAEKRVPVLVKPGRVEVAQAVEHLDDRDVPMVLRLFALLQGATDPDRGLLLKDLDYIEEYRALREASKAAKAKNG